MSHGEEIKKGGLGILSVATGYVVASLQDVELILKIVSLTIGSLVGLATLISIICKIRRDNRRFDQEVDDWEKKHPGHIHQTKRQKLSHKQQTEET